MKSLLLDPQPINYVLQVLVGNLVKELSRFVQTENISTPIQIDLDENGRPKLLVSTDDPFNLAKNFQKQCNLCGPLQIFLPTSLAQIEALGVVYIFTDD